MILCVTFLFSTGALSQEALTVNLALDAAPAQFTKKGYKLIGEQERIRPGTPDVPVFVNRVNAPSGASEIGGMVFFEIEGREGLFAVAKKYFERATQSPEQLMANLNNETKKEVDEKLNPPPPACDPPPPAENERPPLKLLPGRTLVHESGRKEELARWDECEVLQRVMGNYKKADCTSREISKEFALFMGRNLPECAAAGLSKIRPDATLQLPIQLVHNGIAGDQAHKDKVQSNHNLLRAIDLISLDLTVFQKREDRTTRTIKVALDYSVAATAALKKEDDKALTPYETAQLNFWTELQSCWKDKVKAAYGGKCSTHEGCINWNNADHRHHLHLSLPLCPPQVGNQRFYTDTQKKR